MKNFGRACPAIFLVNHIEAGTVTNAISVSSGEIVIIMIVTPTTVSRAVKIWLTLSCCTLSQVVDVVGHPAEQVATRVAVDIGQWKTVELRFDLAP